jgi:GT2 family glycosyltransferase
VQPLQDARVGIAGGAIRALPPANAVAAFGEQIHDHRLAIEVFEPHYAITMSWASPRALLQRLGGFDARFRRCEDVDLAYRVQQAGYALRFAPRAVVYHRNETTLRGLFQEGFLHGVYAVQTHKAHRAYVAAYGHRRLYARGYLDLAATCARAARGPGRAIARCECAFGLGKKLGKALGSLRFADLDL